MQECLENTDLQSHADVKVYYMNGNAQSVRIYSMENADGKNAEYSYNGQNIGSFGGLNATRFKLLTDVDFESATAADIDAIDAGTIQSSNIKGKEELIGAVIAFKTGAKSSAGSGKVGLMKLVAIGEKIGTNANAAYSPSRSNSPRSNRIFRIGNSSGAILRRVFRSSIN